MIVGGSPAIKRAVSLAERYARTKLSILIVGATGTGKEEFARHVHEQSGRPPPLVDVNCCALPRDMVESLFFGHRRGAFTGAVETTVGYIEQSDGGTLFLDELGSLALEAQGKLLRVLETGEVQPLGAGTRRRVDLRLVSAAQPEIGNTVGRGHFRRDLYQRVAGVVIELPPLAARPEDVMPLACHFASLRGQRLEPGAAHVLHRHSWPGNVRELRMVIERAGELVANGALPAGAVSEAIALGASRVIECDHASNGGSERIRLLEACRAADFHGARAAAVLGISRATLFNRLRSQGLSLRELGESNRV